LPIFVTPSTIRAMSFPNSDSTSSIEIEVSSTTSCTRPLATVTESSWRSARIFATSTQCETYGSPDSRFWPACARSLNWYARTRRSRSRRSGSASAETFHPGMAIVGAVAVIATLLRRSSRIVLGR
jgi:hypothetical protein